MISLLLSVTTGDDFRAARRRLVMWLAYGGVVAILLPLVFLRDSLRTAMLVLGLSFSVYVVALVLPVIFVPIAARMLTKYSNAQIDDLALGVFYLLAPTREWLFRRKVELLRLDQFVAVIISDQKLQFWGSGRQPRLLYEADLREGVRPSLGHFNGYPCLMLHLDDREPLQLLQWKELLAVRRTWPEDWINKIENAAARASEK